MNQTAWVVGASGLVGSELVRQLAAHSAYDRVLALVRRNLPTVQDLDGIAAHAVDFSQLRDSLPEGPVGHVYCALGSTRRKTPDQGDFRQIDVLHPLTVAKAAQTQGATAFAVVSAPGAHPFSRFTYLQLKGELESRLQAMAFDKLVVAQPGLLLGDRDEERPMEDFIARHRWLHRLMPEKMRPIPADAVAAAMIAAMTGGGQGVHWLTNATMLDLVNTIP